MAVPRARKRTYNLCDLIARVIAAELVHVDPKNRRIISALPKNLICIMRRTLSKGARNTKGFFE